MKSNDSQQQTYGARYPTYGFWVDGVGNTDKGHPPHPYETFSYDEALLDAGIEDFNIVTYSSVLPLNLQIVPFETARSFFYHGAVLEVIMAGIGATYSESPAKANVSIRRHGRNYILDSEDPVVAIAACLGQLVNVKDKNGNSVGGYVAEYVGTFDTDVTEQEARDQAHTQLKESLENILSIRGYTGGDLTLRDVTFVKLSPEKKYGYALSALGFVGFRDATAPPSS